MTDTTAYPLAHRDAVVSKWGLGVLVALLPIVAIPRFIPDAPALPWPVLALVAVLAARVGIAVFRQACGMNPLAWACFKMAGLDPAEEYERARRGERP